MKVGIVTTWFDRGAAYVSRQYMSALQSAGHEVAIYARGGEFEAKDDSRWNLPEVHWGKRRPFPISNYIDPVDFKNWLDRAKPTHVIFNEQTWHLPVLVCRERKIHTSLYVDYYTESTLFNYGIYDLVLCNTKRHAEAFSWHPRCVYIPWGTETDKFLPDAKRRSDGRIRFFISAGMNPYRKGVDLALLAYCKALTRSEFFADNTELHIHTQVPLDEFLRITPNHYKDSVVGILENLPPQVFVHQSTVGPPGLYNLGDIYVYPSRLDGIGLTLAEAIASGMPVIVPDEPPMNERIPSDASWKLGVERRVARSDGYYWPQCSVNVDELSKVFLNCGTLSRDELRKMSQDARNYAENQLDWGKNAARVGEILSEARILDVDKRTEDSARTQFSRKYPMIHKHERLYSFGWRIFNNVRAR